MRAVVAVLGAVALALGVVVSAGAKGAPIHTQVSFTAPFDECGIQGTAQVQGVDIFWPVFDGDGNVVSFKDNAQIKQTFTANGKTLVVAAAGQHTGFASGDFNGLITFTDNYRGLPERIYAPGGPVLTRDAGIVTQVTVVDFSTNPDGDVVSSTITLEKGPHPEADADFNLFCQVFTQVLG
jgi:hypothetical protein